MRRFHVLLIAAAMGLFLTTALLHQPLHARPGEIVGNGLQYRYLLELPTDATTAEPPLVIALHGYGGDFAEFRESSDLWRLTDAGYGVLFLQGQRDEMGQRHWNANLTLSDNDDVTALRDIIRTIQRDFGFSPQRTFLVGYSNGGFMGYSLACRTEGLLTAFAVVGGTMSGRDWATCPEVQTEPMLHIHGIDDTVVPLDGAITTQYGWGGAPDVQKVIAAWANRLGLGQAVTARPSRNVMQQLFPAANGTTLTMSVLLRHVGHDWPSQTTTGYDTVEAIEAFFANVPSLETD